MIRPKMESRVREVAPRFAESRMRVVNKATRMSKVTTIEQTDGHAPTLRPSEVEVVAVEAVLETPDADLEPANPEPSEP